jgi:hypothetical protein
VSRRVHDRIISLAWLATGLAICVSSIRISLGRLPEPGPGFFSFLSGAILSVLSFALFWGTLNSRSGKDETSTLSAPLWPDRRRARKMMYVLIALVLYTVGMDYIGFAGSTLLFLGFVLRIVDPQPWRTVVTCSILGSAGSWFIFKYWLDIRLPGGFIGY